jgi:biotin transport system substrate-specific component
MSTRDIVYIALFAAIVAALGVFPPIVLPLIGVPITAQSLGVMLAGSVLGAKRGSLAIVLFLVLVAIGVPLLAGGRGGFGVFLGPSGGFLFGWPVAAFVIGWMIERSWSRLDVWRGFGINTLGGIVVMYMFGVPWIAVVAEISLWQAFIGVMGFVPGDVIKAAVAAFVAVTVKRSYPIIDQVETGRA